MSQPQKAQHPFSATVNAWMSASTGSVREVQEQAVVGSVDGRAELTEPGDLFDAPQGCPVYASIFRECIFEAP